MSSMFSTTRDLIFLLIFFQARTFSCFQVNREDGLETTNPLDLPEETEPEDIYADKDESFANCDKFDLEPDEYVLFPNGTAYVADYNKTYSEKFYYLDGAFLQVCKPIEAKGTSDPTHTLASNILSLLTNIGLGVSMVCLVAYLVVFALVPELRNLPGWNMASLCLSLFLSYVLMIVALIKEVFYNKLVCVIVGGMMQFFFLASFLWMFIIAVDVFRTIRKATSNLRMSTKEFNVKKCVCQNLTAWGIAGAFTAAAMVVDNIGGIPDQFKPQFEVFCWFKPKEALLIYFAGPVFILIGINFILFGLSVCTIFSSQIKSGLDNQQSNFLKRQMMYFRLGIIMGVTWITGVLAPILDKLWLWCLFAALNAFQGFFIFIAFTCTSKVKNHFRQKCCGGRKTSS